jgi:hypothetical protein
MGCAIVQIHFTALQETVSHRMAFCLQEKRETVRKSQFCSDGWVIDRYPIFESGKSILFSDSIEKWETAYQNRHSEHIENQRQYPIFRHAIINQTRDKLWDQHVRSGGIEN